MSYHKPHGEKRSCWNIGRHHLVRFGAILLILSFMVLSVSAENEPQKLKQGEVRTLLKEMKFMNKKRGALQKKQNQLMNEMTKLKKQSMGGRYKPGAFLAKRELREMAAEFHAVLEEEGKITAGQRRIIGRLLSDKEISHQVIEEEKNNILEKQKDLDENSRDFKVLNQKIVELESFIEIMTALERSPNFLGFMNDVEEEKERRGYRAEKQRDNQDNLPRGPMRGMNMRREMSRDMNPGERIQARLNRLQHQQNFLRKQLERNQKDLDYLIKIVENVRKNHPEFLEELKDIEAPPHPEFQDEHHPAPPGMPPH